MHINPKQHTARFPIDAIVLGGAVWLAYMLTCIGTSGDSRWSIPTALSIIYERNVDLNEYAALIEIADGYAIETVDGHQYTRFPIATSFAALPFVAVLEVATRAVATMSPRLEEHLVAQSAVPYPRLSALTFYWRVEQAIASFYAALAIAIFYLYACTALPRRSALALSLLLAFCTTIWSVAATALWQHAPSLVLLATALLLIEKSETHQRYLKFIPIALALAYIVRPTNSIPLVLLSITVVVRHREYALKYIAWGLCVGLPFCVYSLIVYGALLPPYYMPGRIGGHDDFWLALAANLISPARGLFIYSPFLLFAFWGVYLRLKDSDRRPLSYALLAIIALHWISISSFPHWWGGVSFGPRFFTDVLPFMAYFLIPVFEQLPKTQKTKRQILTAAITACVLMSLFIHYRGASSIAVWDWNATPVHIDEQPSRIWDWKDLSFLRFVS